MTCFLIGSDREHAILSPPKTSKNFFKFPISCLLSFLIYLLSIMAPLVLKIKGNKTFLPFSTLASEDELSQTWRVCTKVKDSLENGSRLENLSWRLWFKQHLVNDKSFQKLSVSTARKLSSLTKLTSPPASTIKMEPREEVQKEDLRKEYLLQQEQLIQQQRIEQQQLEQQQIEQQIMASKEPLLDTSFFDTPAQQNNFTLPQFTSDQSSNEIVALDDIFNAFNTTDFNTTDMGMADGWDFGMPSPTNPYYSPTDTTAPILPMYDLPQTTLNNEVSNDAMYVSASSMPPPPPNGTLRNKLMGTMPMRFNSSGSAVNTGGNGFNTGESPSSTMSNSPVQMGVLMDDITIGTAL